MGKGIRLGLMGLLAMALAMGNAARGQNAYRTLPPAAMQHDLTLLHKAWTSLHPGLYRFNTPEQIELDFAALHLRCRQPMDERRFYVLLAQQAQKVHCGHTYLNPLNMPDTVARRFLPQHVLPVLFEVVGGRHLIVTRNLSDNARLKPGDELVAVNGIRAEVIIDSLLSVSRSDGLHAQGKKLNNINITADESGRHTLFDIFFPLFFGASSDFFFTVKPLEGRPYDHARVKGLTSAQRAEAYRKKFGKGTDAASTWQYRLLDSQTAYMKFGTFAFWNSPFMPKDWIDSVFKDLAAHPAVGGLIIDLRGNEGGDNSGDDILSYLASAPFGCDDPDHPCYRFLTVPDSLLPHLSTWDKAFKQPKDSSLFFKNGLGLYERKGAAEHCRPIQPQKGRFVGKVVMLIDAKNSSAGFETARNFKAARLGTLVGETTGGCQQGINGGEFFFLTLPNSGFELDLPLIYNYHPDKPDRGIDPDYEVHATQADIAAGRDAQLAKARAVLGK